MHKSERRITELKCILSYFDWRGNYPSACRACWMCGMSAYCHKRLFWLYNKFASTKKSFFTSVTMPIERSVNSYVIKWSIKAWWAALVSGSWTHLSDTLVKAASSHRGRHWKKMKLVVVVLLFASATADVHNWVGLPDTRFEQVDQLMQGTYHFCLRFLYSLSLGVSVTIFAFSIDQVYL